MSEDILEKQLFEVIRNNRLSEDIKFAKIDMLIKLGANVNAVEKNDNTPLMMACAFGHEKIARLLIDKGANIHQKNDKGCDALMIASWIGYNEKILELLLEKGADVHQKNEDGETALHKAAFNGSKEFVRILLDNGANIDELDGSYVGPLEKAYLGKNKEVFEYLISRGADTSTESVKGVLSGAMFDRDKLSYAVILAKKGVGLDDICYLNKAVSCGCREIVEAYLEQGINVNAMDMYGDFPLEEAVFKNNREMVELLIEHGADINMKDRLGNSVLDTATTSKEMKELMIELDKRKKQKKNDASFFMKIKKGFGLDK